MFTYASVFLWSVSAQCEYIEGENQQDIMHLTCSIWYQKKQSMKGHRLFGKLALADGKAALRAQQSFNATLLIWPVNKMLTRLH